MAQKIQKRFFV